MIKKDKIIYPLFGILIVFDILYKSNSVFYIPFGASLAMLFIALLACNRGVFKKKNVCSSYVFCFAVFVIYSFVTCFVSDGMEIYVIKNLIIFILFFVTIFMLARFSASDQRRYLLLKTLVVSISLVLVISFFFSEWRMDYFAQLKSFFNTANRYRYSFGLGHYNDAGLNSISLIIISYLFFSQYKNRISPKFRFLMFFCDIVALFILLGSSCRNALIALLLFVLVYYFFCASGEKNKKIKYPLIVCIMLFLILGVINLLQEYYNANSLNELWKYSGRSVALLGIDTMINDNKYLFGYGLTNKTDFLQYASLKNKIFVLDSSYIYYLVHSGIIGFFIFATNIYCVLRNIFKTKDSNVKYKYLILSSCVMFCFTGLFETTIYYSGMPISLFFTVIILQYAMYGGGKD